jgi:hypothetical protein
MTKCEWVDVTIFEDFVDAGGNSGRLKGDRRGSSVGSGLRMLEEAGMWSFDWLE